MLIEFIKYQGAGNDFIIIDNRINPISRENNKLIKFLCDRRFGIGADGLMFLQHSNDYNFEMVYYNADGFESTMCGNGGRCIVAFAHYMGIIEKKTTFIAADGIHDAIVKTPDLIKLKMIDVEKVETGNDYFFLNTGVPHFVKFIKNIDGYDVFTEGRNIRYSKQFAPNGTNANFVELINDEIKIRTYERGVEDETLACGTGITASAIAASLYTNSDKNNFTLIARGGILNVSLEKIDNSCFRNIWLEGPATLVFKGRIRV